MSTPSATPDSELVGPLPRGWKAMPAGEAIEFKNGLNYVGGQVGSENGIKVIGVGDFAHNFYLNSRNFERVYLPDGVDPSCLLKDNDLLFVRSNGNKALIGRVMFLTGITEPISHSGFTIRGRVISNDTLPLFVAYYFSSSLVKRQFARFGGGTNISNLSQETLKQVVLPRPPIQEQQEIAAILSTWDRAIELTEKLIAAKQKRKAALLHQLLAGNVRLSQFGKSQDGRDIAVVAVPAMVRRGVYPPSVQPGIPKIDRAPGWNETTMGKLLQVEKRPIELQDDQIYQLVVAKRNRGGIKPRERLQGKEIKTLTQFAVHQGDFVISRRQIIHGACGVVPQALDGAIVSNEYAVCRVKDELDINFLKHLSHTLYFQQTCFHASVGVAIEKMIFQLDRWLAFPFMIPAIAEQQAIAAVLNTQDREIDLHARKLDALRRQKKGLMQQLLTGKVRVKVPDEPPGG